MGRGIKKHGHKHRDVVVDRMAIAYSALAETRRVIKKTCVLTASL